MTSLPLSFGVLTGSNITSCQEILDSIIDCFGEQQHLDKEMVSVCSLVAHNWLHRSQKRLLQTISLGSDPRIHEFLSSLPTLSERARLFIQEIIIETPTSLQWSNPFQVHTISITQLIKLLDALPSLAKLSLLRLKVLVDNESYHPRRSLQYLHLSDITDTTLSWHAMHEVIAVASLFESVDDLHVGIDEFLSSGPGRDGIRRDGLFRREMSWIANITTPLSVKSIHIRGPPTTHLHTLRFLRMSNSLHTLNSMQLALLDPDIILEVEAILQNDSSKIESLTLGLNPLTHRIYADEWTVGYNSEPMYDVPLIWTIDTSLLSNLRTLRLNYQLPNDDGFKAFSLNQWTQLLRILDHFSAAPVRSIYLDLTAFMMCDLGDPGELSMLGELSWPRVGAVLQRFKRLKTVYVDLHCISIHPLETHRSLVSGHLQPVLEGLADLKSKGKARLTCTYQDLTKEGKIEEFMF